MNSTESKPGKLFAKYVSQNIFAMIGISAYVLADTFFISRAEGADGIAALNLVLPLYSFIFAIGSMIGVGSATRFKIGRARNESATDFYFGNAISWAFLISLVFVFAGALFAEDIMELLGADASIARLGVPYTKIFMLFAPFFMCNYILNAFVRNDGSPMISMIATLTSSLFNIVMDYVLMFPLGLGMAGAALATACSPIVGILICSVHFFQKKNTISFRFKGFSLVRLLKCCQLGISAFVGEMSSGVTTMVFNFLILSLSGNVGIAAFGVVANTAIVATSIYNGIAQGSQPLLSDFYGRNSTKNVGRILGMSIATALVVSGVIVTATNIFPSQIVEIFNSEGDALMAKEAIRGVRLYFLGFVFAGINIVGAGYLSATENAMWAFVTSILRGFVAIIACAFIMSSLFGMTGVWLAFPLAELLTMIVMIIALIRSGKKKN